jgi:cellulose synthase/poly-beta-1,6-N-acetylglucosamine synthase-like glycosyltransferase
LTFGHLGPLSLLTLVVGAFVALFDFQNMLSRSRRLVLSPLESATIDFTVVIPLFGHPRYFDEREQLEHLKERIVVVVEVSSELMRSFATELEQEGWNVFRAIVPEPSPPKLLLEALEADAVQTGYVMRLDADSCVGEELPNAVAAAAADGADLCSVKVLARNRTVNLCTRFQGLEYDMAMLARHYRPWLISGAGVVARTAMLHQILRRHSLSPIGEDIEMGRVAFAGKLRIRHLDIAVQTDVPGTWRALFRQRRLWWAGNFRHSFVNFDRNAFQLRWWTMYNLSILWMTLHFHVWSYVPLLLHPTGSFLALAAIVVVAAAVTTAIANWQVRTPLMAIFPFYAMLQSGLIFTVGAACYLRHLLRFRNVGRYRFGLRRSTLEPALPAPGWTRLAAEDADREIWKSRRPRIPGSGLARSGSPAITPADGTARLSIESAAMADRITLDAACG